MKADAAEFGHAENLLRDDLGDERQDRQIGVQRDEFVAHFRRFERFMLAHRDAEFDGFLFYRIEFAVGRIGRAIDRDDFLAFAEEFFQSLFGKRRLSDQYYSHLVKLRIRRASALRRRAHDHDLR